MTSAAAAGGQAEWIAPVELEGAGADSVSHSLAVLSRIYHYNHWIFSGVRDFVGSSVLEVGAGIGNITQFLLNCDELTCLEPFAPYRKYLAARFAKHQNVRVLPLPIEECPCGDAPEGTFDTIICLNVLEHIEKDEEALRRFRRLLKDGGRAIVLVPAMQSLYGEMDRAMGHHRRYSRRALRRLFLSAGLRPVHSRYMNVLGAAGWFWRGRVLRKKTIPESQTLAFDRMVPLLSAVESILPLPFGQSLVMVGEAG